jgi:hypothetical protein
MAGFLRSPHLIDLVVALTVLEGAFLIVVGRRRQLGSRSQTVIAIVLMMLPGVCLLLAIRAALAGAPWPWVPAALVAALLAHLADVRQRWLS